MSASATFRYRRETAPEGRGALRFVAERADGVVITWLKEHHEGPLATLWSYRDGDLEAIFFGDVDVEFMSVGADGLPRDDNDVRITYRLPRESFLRQNGPPPSAEKRAVIWRNITDAFRNWPAIWDPVPKMRLNDVVLV